MVSQAPPPAPAPAPAPLRPLAVAAWIALLCLIWGSTWVVIARGLDDTPPFTAATARFGLAALTMTVLAPFLARNEGGTRPPLWLMLAVGACNFGVSYSIVYWSEAKLPSGDPRLPSGLVAVLWSVFPMLMAAAGHFFLHGDRLVARQVLGFVVGFGGVALLFATDLRALSATAVPSALVTLLSPTISMVGTALLKRYGKHASSVLLNRDAMWFGAAILGAMALWQERDARAVWTPAAIASVVYLALVGTALAFGVYFWLLRRTKASTLSLIAYVTPAIALTLGALVRGEPVTAWTLAASATILVGVALVVAPKRALKTEARSATASSKVEARAR